jgi:hypothetical protein
MSQTEGDTISIAQPADGEIQIIMRDGEKLSEVYTLLEGEDDFECEGGRIWVVLASSFDVDFGAAGVDSTKMGLARVEDGSLVGEEHSVLAGVFVVAPVRISEKSYLRWKPVSDSFEIEDKTRLDVMVHRGRGVDQRRLDDVDTCTLYIYTMGQSVSARFIVDTDQYADVTIARSEYGQMSLEEGAYRIAATFDDGSVDEFDVGCKYSRSIAGRHYSKRFVQISKSLDGNYSATLQPAETAIRNMKRGVITTVDRSRVEIPVGLRSELDRNQLEVDGHCVIYFFLADPRSSLSARLFINTSQFSDLVLKPSEYAMLTIEQEANSITAEFGDSVVGNIDFVCQMPSSLHIAMLGGMHKLSLMPGRFGVRQFLAE